MQYERPEENGQSCLRILTVQDIPDLKSNVGPVVGLLLFSLFWCSIVGVFAVGGIIRPIARYAAAKGSYISTTGLVTAGEVEVETDPEGTSYTPVVRYWYVVEGERYTGEQVTFADMGGSSRGYAEEVVAKYPVDSKVTVYYNGDVPSDAVLELVFPTNVVFLALFMQPFILVAFFLPCFGLKQRGSCSRSQDFVNGPSKAPLTLLYWGILEGERGHYAVIRKTGLLHIVGGFAIGYGAACFVSIFIVGFVFGGIGSGGLKPTLICWAVAVVMGVVASIITCRYWASRGALEIDTMDHVVRFTSKAQSLVIPFADILHWGLTWVDNPGAQSEGGNQLAPLLGVSTRNTFVPLHFYRSHGDSAEPVVIKTGLVLAELTGHDLCEVDPPAELMPVDADSFGQVREAYRDSRRRQKTLNDLL